MKKELSRFDIEIIAATKKIITKVLEECNGNQAKASRALGFDRRTMYNKMKVCGIPGKQSIQPVVAENNG